MPEVIEMPPEDYASPDSTTIHAANAADAPEAIAVTLGDPIMVKVTAIDGPKDVVQWRIDDNDWKGITIGAKEEGRIGLRTGLGASVTLTLADQVVVKASRLTRVKFETRPPEKEGLPVELVVELSRGEVEIKPLPVTVGGPPPAVVRIITPDKSFNTRLATGVRVDAFSGTRLRMVAGER
jgi:hypothetical protein